MYLNKNQSFLKIGKENSKYGRLWLLLDWTCCGLRNRLRWLTLWQAGAIMYVSVFFLNLDFRSHFWLKVMLVITLCWWLFLYKKFGITVSNLSPTESVCIIRHQHRFKLFLDCKKDREEFSSTEDLEFQEESFQDSNSTERNEESSFSSSSRDEFLAWIFHPSHISQFNKITVYKNNADFKILFQ